jgi:hypothetical protein
MAVAYGKTFEEETGRDESYAEFDELVWNGDSYVFRITALFPYKDYANGKDELYCHIDFLNVTQGTSGRFPNVWLPAREQGDANLRRFSAIRKLKDCITNDTAIPSPVYP